MVNYYTVRNKHKQIILLQHSYIKRVDTHAFLYTRSLYNIGKKLMDYSVH